MNSECQNGMRWASRSFPCQTTLGFYEIWYLRYQHSAVKSFTSSRTVYALKYINYEVDFTNICVLYYTALLHGYNRLKEQSGEKTSNNWNFWRTNLILKFWANSHQKSSFWGEHWEQEYLVPWYIWNQHLSLSTATAGPWWHFGDSLLSPSCRMSQLWNWDLLWAPSPQWDRDLCDPTVVFALLLLGGNGAEGGQSRSFCCLPGAGGVSEKSDWHTSAESSVFGLISLQNPPMGQP